MDDNRQHTERLPLPFQGDLVYEAAATIYEHDFIEAPTGAGKTDIGKHLAATPSEMRRHVGHALRPSLDSGVESDVPTHVRRRGSFAVVPTRAQPNWEHHRPTAFDVVSLSAFSKDAKSRPDEMRNLARRFDAIDDAWVLAKRQIREVMRARDDTSDYLGIDAVMSVFRVGDPETIEAVRQRMRQALMLARAASEGRISWAI